VFDNRVLRKIFGLKSEKVRGDWRKLHNNEIYVCSSSTNIIMVTKSRQRRWVEHVACRGRRKMQDRNSAC
jgi:hypothetical protein